MGNTWGIKQSRNGIMRPQVKIDDKREEGSTYKEWGLETSNGDR